MRKHIPTSQRISADEEMVFGAPHAFYERKGDGYDDMVISYPFTFQRYEKLWIQM